MMTNLTLIQFRTLIIGNSLISDISQAAWPPPMMTVATPLTEAAVSLSITHTPSLSIAQTSTPMATSLPTAAATRTAQDSAMVSSPSTPTSQHPTIMTDSSMMVSEDITVVFHHSSTTTEDINTSLVQSHASTYQPTTPTKDLEVMAPTDGEAHLTLYLAIDTSNKKRQPYDPECGGDWLETLSFRVYTLLLYSKFKPMSDFPNLKLISTNKF